MFLKIWILKKGEWVFSTINPIKYQRILKFNKKILRIGRGEQNEIIVHDKFISRKCVKIEMKKGLWFIEELPENKNGLFKFQMVIT